MGTWVVTAVQFLSSATKHRGGDSYDEMAIVVLDVDLLSGWVNPFRCSLITSMEIATMETKKIFVFFARCATPRPKHFRDVIVADLKPKLLSQERSTGGRSSSVERHLAKVRVVGSTPIVRSNVIRSQGD